MILSAYVQIDFDESSNLTQKVLAEGDVAVAQKLAPAWVEIVQDETGASLLQYGAEGTFIADTRHENVEAAKRQAEQEFGVQEKNWFEEC